MRAVEQVPFGGQRSTRHDAMCLAIATRPERIFPRFMGVVRAKVEAPIGRGFADVLAITDAPGYEVDVAIVEVKTRDERYSAGDVIRQLRWYAQNLPEYLRHRQPRLILVVENVDAIDSTTLGLVSVAGVEILPVAYFTQESE